MKINDKVVCVDDEHWLISQGVFYHHPIKGKVYTITAIERFGSVLAYSLVGFHPDDYYRACRFRPLISHPEHGKLANCSIEQL